MNFSIIFSRLADGFSTTLAIFIITLIISLPLGLVISFITMSKIKPLSLLSKSIIWVVRGTPLMLQLVVVYFLPNSLFDIPMRNLDLPFVEWRFIAVILAFSFNYAIYFSEIYRSGIQGISVGQTEAGTVLGLTKMDIFKKIILPQVIKRILPPMGNEIITLVKDTALVSILAVVEVTFAAKEIVAVYGTLTPLFCSGLFYLVFNGILTLVFNKLENKLSYYR